MGGEREREGHTLSLQNPNPNCHHCRRAIVIVEHRERGEWKIRRVKREKGRGESIDWVRGKGESRDQERGRGL